MKQIAVADAETDPFKKGRIPAPFIWGFYDGQNYEQFDSTMGFVRYVIDKPIILYAHNGGKFDWHFLLDYIDPFTSVSIINGRIAKFKIGQCEFRDSYNILPTSLKAFRKDDFDYSILEKELRDKPLNRKKIERYLYHDCLYLREYVMGFIDRFGLKLTLAGAAMKQWETISGLKAPDDPGGYVYENFKHFYYGGRCQSFEHGVINDDFVMVDINSAYPFAMLNNHPYGLEFDKIDFSDFESLEKNRQGTCFISCRAISRGALPFRGKDKSLFFPDDNIERAYYITGWEYLAGLDTGTIDVKEILEIWYFPEQQNFSCYINHFYNEKKTAKEMLDGALYIFCKLLMNALYGKFGSNPDTYQNYKTLLPEYLDSDGVVFDEKGKLWHFSGDFGSNILVSNDVNDEQQRFYNVATASSITGFVRAFLWRAICGCDGVLYCDTDSIAARNVRDLPNGYGKELGQWEKEGEFSRAALAGRKLYAMEFNKNFPYDKEKFPGGHKIACKGVRLEASQIFEVAKGATILYEPENPVFSVHKQPHFINRTVKMVKKVLQD